jgi:hypothetical protein
MDQPNRHSAEHRAARLEARVRQLAAENRQLRAALDRETRLLAGALLAAADSRRPPAAKSGA